MKNILYFHSSSDLYGSDRSLLRTIGGLDRSRFAPFVVLPSHGPLVGRLAELGVPVLVFPLAVLRRSVFTPWGLGKFVFSLGRDLKRTKELIRKLHIDAVHTNTGAVIAGGVTARRLGIYHVWHVREIIVHPVIVRKFVARCIDRYADCVVAVSKSVRDHLALDRPAIASKCRIIHNGIETGKFANGDRRAARRDLGVADDEILVGMVGRVNRWKGQGFFVQVAQQVAAVRSGVVFVSIGSPFSGQDRWMGELRETVRHSGLGKRFIIMEFRKEVADFLSAMDIFVQPSTLPDPFPNTVLEAMAAGLPIVASAHGGVTEMLEDGISGCLVPPKQVARMAEQILSLADNPELREKLGSRAKERVNNLFHVDRYRVNMDSLYAETVESDS